MTQKLLWSPTLILSAGFGAGKTLAWYVTRRLQRI
jgi:hypothetical protein